MRPVIGIRLEIREIRSSLPPKPRSRDGASFLAWLSGKLAIEKVIVDRSSLEEIQRAIEAARQAAREGGFDGCDAADLEEIIMAVDNELKANRPNSQTLSTYLNSLAKSLRADPAKRALCLQIDAAMRNAGIATHWEH